MSRPKSTPGYCLHARSGNAYTTIDGRQIQLGTHGSAESKSAYDRLIAQWLLNDRTLSPQTSEGPTVSVIIELFWKHAERYYVHPDGAPTGELHPLRYALRFLRRLYGPTPAANFCARDLKAIREAMITPGHVPDPKTGEPMVFKGWCRGTTNKQIARIKHVFKWAAENDLVPASVHHSLATVSGLRHGRSEARETAPVRAVTPQMVEQVLPYLPAVVRKMVELELLAGCRGGELFRLRGCDIEEGGKTWIYRPLQHKTQHHGHDREIHFGPRAIEILKSVAKPSPTDYLFSPRDAEAQRNADRREARQSPMTPSQAKRAEKAKRRKRARPPGEHYDKDSYARAVRRACEQAFPVPKELQPAKDATGQDQADAQAKIREWKKAHRFHPHQLRHAAATRLRKLYGLEAAGVVFGQKTLAATMIYAERDQELAAKVMGEIG